MTTTPGTTTPSLTTTSPSSTTVKKTTDKSSDDKPVNNNTFFIIIMILGVMPLILWLISMIKIGFSGSVAILALELRFGIKYILLLLCLTLLINIPIMIYNYQKYKSDEHIEEWVNITSIILEVILLILHIYVTFSSFIAPSSEVHI